MTSNKNQTVKNSAAVLTKATLRVAERLGVDDASLACIIGINVEAILGYRRGDMTIAPSAPEGGQSVLLIAVFCALDVLVGADEGHRIAWMTGENTALGGVPLQVIQRSGGLVTVLTYLEDHVAGTLLS